MSAGGENAPGIKLDVTELQSTFYFLPKVVELDNSDTQEGVSL